MTRRPVVLLLLVASACSAPARTASYEVRSRIAPPAEPSPSASPGQPAWPTISPMLMRRDRGMLVVPRPGVQEMRPTHIDFVVANGRELFVHYAKSPHAAALGRVELQEHREEVRLGIWTGFRPGFRRDRTALWTLQMGYYKTKVMLDRPLSNRVVIDTSDGSEVSVI